MSSTGGFSTKNFNFMSQRNNMRQNSNDQFRNTIAGQTDGFKTARNQTDGFKIGRNISI
jgi:hypothetical protein